MINQVEYELQHKCLLLIGCLLNLYQLEFHVNNIFFILLMTASSLLMTFKPTPLIKGIVLVISIILTLHFNVYGLFFPVILYDLLEKNKPLTYILFPLLGITLTLITYSSESQILIFSLFTMILSSYLNWQGHKQLSLENVYSQLERSSQEQQYLLEKKNNTLIEEQNLNLSLGISEEQNRIARDIHDNVGHLLSSALIQIGALKILNKDTVLEKPIELLDQTIQEGMDNIRQSVHDLHDDSLDLKQSLHFLIEQFQGCPITLRYKIKETIVADLKMDFLMIVRESLANVMKHSNGTQVVIEVIE